MASAMVHAVTSLVLGSLMGLLFVFVAGMGKLVPGHPMYSTLRDEFDKLVGPYLGLPAAPLRVLLGLAEVSAGFAILVIVWAEELGMLSDVKVAAVAHAVLFCAIVGLITVMIGAGTFHALVEGHLAGIPYIGFVTLLAAVGAAHVAMGDFATMPRIYQQLIAAFVALCLVSLPLSQCWACAFGITQAEALKRNAEVEQLKQQLLSQA